MIYQHQLPAQNSAVLLGGRMVVASAVVLPITGLLLWTALLPAAERRVSSALLEAHQAFIQAILPFI
jgi:hypothetical protein